MHMSAFGNGVNAVHVCGGCGVRVVLLDVIAGGAVAGVIVTAG